MLLAPICATQVLAKAHESRDRLMEGMRGGSYLEVQLRVPYSFPLEEEGAGGEKTASMTHPQLLSETHTSTLCLSVSLSASFWLPV